MKLKCLSFPWATIFCSFCFCFFFCNGILWTHTHTKIVSPIANFDIVKLFFFFFALVLFWIFILLLLLFWILLLTRTTNYSLRVFIFTRFFFNTPSAQCIYRSLPVAVTFRYNHIDFNVYFCVFFFWREFPIVTPYTHIRGHTTRTSKRFKMVKFVKNARKMWV